MRFLTDTEIAKVRADAELAYSNFASTDLCSKIDFDKRSLSDLVILRASYEALMEMFDETIALRVEQGRMAGGSWAEIGKILGISKQAAQQKFGS